MRVCVRCVVCVRARSFLFYFCLADWCHCLALCGFGTKDSRMHECAELAVGGTAKYEPFGDMGWGKNVVTGQLDSGAGSSPCRPHSPASPCVGQIDPLPKNPYGVLIVKLLRCMGSQFDVRVWSIR